MALPEAVRAAVEYSLLGLHTAMPGRIENYDAARNKATVKPLIKRVLADGKVESLPVISNVPVVFPRTAAASLRFKVAKGDGVVLIFAERALERWLANGGEQEPGKPRHHDMNDAIAFLGAYSFAEPPSDDGSADVLLKAGVASLRLDGGKLALGAGATEVLEVLSLALAALAVSTVGGTPLNNAATFTALQVQIDAIRGPL
jgi:hypothetical protein